MPGPLVLGTRVPLPRWQVLATVSAVRVRCLRARDLRCGYGACGVPPQEQAGRALLLLLGEAVAHGPQARQVVYVARQRRHLGNRDPRVQGGETIPCALFAGE